jgi:hypothetical protein
MPFRIGTDKTFSYFELFIKEVSFNEEIINDTASVEAVTVPNLN